jgi:hypothetical protein
MEKFENIKMGKIEILDVECTKITTRKCTNQLIKVLRGNKPLATLVKENLDDFEFTKYPGKKWP